jgi:hypothetical protein
MSKQGLFARLYAPNQTLIMVKGRLPRGILAAANVPAGASIEARCRGHATASRNRRGALRRVANKNIENNPMQSKNAKAESKQGQIWPDRIPAGPTLSVK